MTVKIDYKGYQIRRSGKDFFKVMQNGERAIFSRFVSIEAAKCAINSTVDHRPYTKEEWYTVHGKDNPYGPK